MSIHEDQEVLISGEKPESAERAVVMLHGRGATAQSVLQLSDRLPEASYLAPQASGRTWYPHSFMEPRQKNQPHLDSALEKVGSVMEEVEKNVSRENIVLLGFSQGACLTSEYLAQNPGKYGGGIILSGGLIGEKAQEYSGNLERTPVFLGCSENDPHIPLERVNQTMEVLEELNAEVKKTIYDGNSHTINEDEIEKAGRLIEDV